ncbi:MAG: hypothetical protein ACOYJC_08885 [Christensenellales bacterium]|jgi:hypothetical protein
MYFLNKIDTIYKDSREKFNIPENNKIFSCFIPIEPVGCETSCAFMVKKQEKSKLMLIEGGQRVHISDLQILNTILDMDKNDIEWFLQQFILLYKGKTRQMKFKIDGDLFSGFGIGSYPTKKILHLFSDSLIDINDFVFILNFIFAKDKCWEEMNKQHDFSKRTLCKYITLIDYYAHKAPRSKSFLKAIGYPVKKENPVDNRYTKPLFNHIEKFDISQYG